MNLTRLLTLGCLMWVCLTSGWSQESGKSTVAAISEETPRYSLSVEQVLVTDMQIHDTIDVDLNSFGQQVGGFELKFAVESPYIAVDTILPGRLQDSCQWQFFSARSVNTVNREGYPPVLWQVVALARGLTESEGPLCYSLDGEVSLARLVVSSAHMARIPDTVAPIFFFWEDCTDNSISSLSGDTLAVAAGVTDFDDVEVQEKPNRFPSRTGVPDGCIDLSKPNHPLRLIEFHTGGVEFKLDVFEGSADSSQTDTSKK